MFGSLFIVGVPAMMMVIWPDEWSWSLAQPEDEQMIMGIYIILGIFLVRVAKDPMANTSLLWFRVWYRLVHACLGNHR